jgi:hypothetical protein
MNTKTRTLICILAAVPAWTGLRAADPPEAPKTGHILLLANERTLEGDIERVGDQFRIKRSLGETWVPAQTTLSLCTDLNDAYSFLRRRTNLDDPDERLHLATWCHNHGLREEALTEVKAAVELAPNYKEAKRLLNCLQQAPATSAGITHSRSDADSESKSGAPPVEVTAKSMSEFATHIQPILMNACASCHAGSQGGSFKLVRTSEPGVLAPRTTQQNLTAVLAQLNLEQPRSSPFLTKAVAVHGSLTQAPLSGRQMPAFHAMEEWVKLTLTDRPGAHEQPVLAAQEWPAKESKPTVAAPEKLPGTKAATTAKPEDAPSSFSEDPSPKDKEPVDPFDPVIFNRQMHPDRK